MRGRIVSFGQYYIEESKITPFMREWLKRHKVSPTITTFTQRTVIPTPIRPHLRRIRTGIVPVRRHKRRIRRVMHRKAMTGIEFEALRKIADRQGIARDLFDFESEIDRSLTYAENKRIIEEKIRRINPSREIEVMSTEQLASEWDDYIRGLKFKADAGDSEARKELKALGYV